MLLAKTVIRFFPLFLSIIILAGCSYFEDDNIKPSPLTKFSPTAQLKVFWSANIGGGNGEKYLKLTPAVVNNIIYVASNDGYVTAINCATGKHIWRVKKQMALTSGVAAYDNMLFIGTGTGEVLALKQSDGSLLWSAPVSTEVLATPAVNHGTVVVKCADGKLFALGVKSGAKFWEYESEESSLILRGSSAPKIVNAMVVSGFASGRVVALDLASGKVLWQEQIAKSQGRSVIERLNDINADPLILDGVIYTAAYQGNVTALTLEGKFLWQQEFSAYTDLAFDDVNIYATNDHGYISAFDRKTGAKVWKQAALENRYVTGPAVIGRNIVVGDAEGYVHMLAIKDGHFVAREKLDKSGVVDKPLVSNGAVYVLTKSGKCFKILLQLL
jgi:outer membrane protein assembly factor BamB